jgi:hypothetical protein
MRTSSCALVAPGSPVVTSDPDDLRHLDQGLDLVVV